MLIILVCAALGRLQAAPYCPYSVLTERLTALQEHAPETVRLQLLAKSQEGRDVWLVELGLGSEPERKARPAVLVVAGVEGNDLVGSALVLSWLEGVVERSQDDPNLARLLETTTLYAICRLNPDGAEHFFANPRWETAVNGKPCDDDHDALIDEDGPEDLDGDGLITSMRVEDKEGRYILDPAEPRLLVEADRSKGEVGRWRYLSEGIDNDGDELWNEDGAGGVNFNRNFPFHYEFFGPDAGVHAVCETETRALADFIVTHPNIGLVLTYGGADNLLKTPKEGKAPARREPMTAIDDNDVLYYRALGEAYRETLGLDKELEDASEPGTFSDWMYFHRGRLSLAALPWSPKLAIAMAEGESQEKSEPEARADKAEPKKKKDKDEDKRGKEAREQLKWFDEHAPEAFRPWQPFEHPDFPGRRVEIGSYAPFALTNPPESMLEDLADKHRPFLTGLLDRLPRIGLREGTCTHLGESVFEIELQIENTGFLPTILAHGERTREVHPTRVVLDVPADRLLSGTRITYVPALAGSGGVAKVRWIVHAPDRSEIRFQVISMLAGQVDGLIDLRDTTVHTKKIHHATVTGDDD